MNANIFHGMTKGVPFDQIMWDNNPGGDKDRNIDRYTYRLGTVFFDKIISDITNINIWFLTR